MSKKEHQYDIRRILLLFLAIIIAFSRPLYGQHRPGIEDWDDRFGHPGIFGHVHAVAADDQGNVYLGGEFTQVNDGSGYREVKNIVRWDGETFHELGAGIQGRVYALEVDQEGHLYVGGHFSRAWQNSEVSINAHHMAKWDGTWWSVLGHPDHNKNGPDQSVSDIMVMGDTVYAAGTFSNVRRPDGTSLETPNIAGWHNGDWFALQSGTDAPVESLAGKDGILYAAGNFEQAGGVAAASIARWDGSDWAALPVDPGAQTMVNAIAFCPDGDLYAGGSFMMIGGVFSMNAARFDGQQWHPMDQGIGFIGPMIRTIVADENFVYFGGSMFEKISQESGGDIKVNHIVRWDGNRWHGMKQGMHGPLPMVNDMVISGGQLYAGGIFGVAGNVAAGNIARWDGFDWHPLGEGSQMGLGWIVRTIGATEHGIYAGGWFAHAGPARISYFARWDGSAWQEVGGGLCNAVEVVSVHEEMVYTGGDFLMAGDKEVNRIAMWDGKNWHAFGRGVNGKVTAITVDLDGRVYAGGEFTRATNPDGSTVAVNYIAMWDGNSWHSLDNGMSDKVMALAFDGDQIYAGGRFRQASGQTVNFIARWDGSSWHDVGGGMNLTVTALASNGSGTIYAGGVFSVAGDKAVSYVAAWDGERWHNMHGGLNGHVLAMAWEEGTLYAGGLLSHGSIARWRYGRWSYLPGEVELGVDIGTVHALAARENNIYIGGHFISAGGMPSYHFASWTDRIRERYDMLMFSKAPRAGSAVETGSTLQLEWTHAPVIQQIRLEIRYGDELQAWKVLVDSLPADAGHYVIDFDDTLHDQVTLLITDRHHPEFFDVSGPFSILSPEMIAQRLRIADDDGSYYIFDLENHAWSFSNSEDNIWPYDKRFPDWDLYCRAMGRSHCYNALGIPRPWALSVWGIMKAFGWQGSCSGFTTSSLMFFNDFYRVSTSFPGHSMLYHVPVNSQARDMMNIHQLRFLKPVAGDMLQQRLKVFNDKPVTTLENIEASLDKKLDHPGLVVMDPGWSLSQIMRVHSVLPVRVERSQDETMATIYLYENQDPSELKELEIDLQENTWTYSRYGVEDAGNGLFISPPLSLFMELEEKLQKPVVMPEKDLLADAGMSTGRDAVSRGERSDPEPEAVYADGTDQTGQGAQISDAAHPSQTGDDGEQPTHMTVFATPGSGILIENTQGDQIGMRGDGNFVHSLGQSMPILSMNPETEPDQPLGYYVPIDEYRISQFHLGRSASQLSMIAGDRLYSYRNVAPQEDDREYIRFQDGVTVINPDAADKQMELEMLAREAGLERQYLLREMDLSPNDSIHVSVGDDLSIQILNIGQQKQYDLRVTEMPENERLWHMDLPGLTITPNSRYLLQTGRDLFMSDSLRIYIDTNLDGIFNDSLRVIGMISISAEDDEVGEEQLPREFGLKQNYPNPFNAATTIAFELPEPTAIRLDLYNMLGQRVVTIEQGMFGAGRHSVVLDGSPLSSGVYIYRLQAGNFTQSRKLLLVK